MDTEHSPSLREEPIGDDLFAEIRDCGQQAKHLLQLSFDANAGAIVEAVHNYVGRVANGGVAISDQDVVSLACIWAQQVCGELNWHWARIIDRTGNEWDGIVSPDARFVIFPIQYVNRIVKGLQQDCYYDNTILLSFNMLKAGNNPKAEPGAYLVLD